MTWLAVLALGAVGASLRFVAAERLSPLIGIGFVNVSAAFALGLTAEMDGIVTVGVQVGLLGAMSTWSTLAHQVATLLREERQRLAVSYLTATLVVGVLAAWAGLALA